MIYIVNNKKFNYEFNDDNNIKINSSRKIYDVNYSNNNIENIVNEIYVKDDFIFIDRNVYNLSPNTFNNLSIILIFDANEDNKNIESVLKLLDELYKSKITKKNKLIVIGGGITQDVGGFTAGIFKRGIKGQFHFVSPKYLSRYLDEFCWRFNNKDSEFMFEKLLTNIPADQTGAANITALLSIKKV